MEKARVSPCVLAFGGLDPGGGAGLFADARAISTAGAFACGVATLLTVQSTSGLKRVIPVLPRDVTAQAAEVIAHQAVRVFKVGALGDATVVRAVARLLRKHSALPSVIDTPMLPSRGRGALLASAAIDALRKVLIPCATVLTVNAPEAATLLHGRVETVEDAEAAAVELSFHGPRAVLVKGGHLGGDRAIDVLAVGGTCVRLETRRLPRLHVHGTGCALASLIAGRLAVVGTGRRVTDDAIVEAVRWAKARLHRELGLACDVGGRQRVLSFSAGTDATASCA